MKNLIYLFFFISFFSFSQEEKRLALVIGNSNYDSIAKLANPVNDAKLIAKTLDSLDFEVILATDLDEENFMIKIIEFRNKRKNYDVGFVYYAGHGIQIDGENYLLPVNKKFDEERKKKDEEEFLKEEVLRAKDEERKRKLETDIKNSDNLENLSLGVTELRYAPLDKHELKFGVGITNQFQNNSLQKQCCFCILKYNHLLEQV